MHILIILVGFDESDTVRLSHEKMKLPMKRICCTAPRDAHPSEKAITTRRKKGGKLKLLQCLVEKRLRIQIMSTATSGGKSLASNALLLREYSIYS